MKYILPVNLRGITEEFTVEYEKGKSAHKAGFDAVSGFDVNQINCINYPTMHGYFADMKLTGYRRYCGIIQLIERTEYYTDVNKNNVELTFDIPDQERPFINPYFTYGYPAEIYDAPCSNLNGCDKLQWKAYTYIVDPSSRLSNFKLDFLGGYSWGYLEDKNGPLDILPFDVLNKEIFEQQIEYLVNYYKDQKILW